MLSNMTGCPSNWISSKHKNGAILLDSCRVATDSRTDENSLVPFPQIRVNCTQQCFGWDLSHYKSGLPSRTHCSNDPAEDFQVEELRASLNLLVPMTAGPELAFLRPSSFNRVDSWAVFPNLQALGR